MLYKKEKLRNISFPLGGIGSGSIGIAGNGSLVDWEIFNRPDKNSINRYTSFAVRAIKGDEITPKILCGDYDKFYCGLPNKQSGFFGHGIDSGTMMGFPHFKNCEFLGEFPFAQVSLSDDLFPGKATIKAFNPFIPLDSKNSSIPAAFFEISYYNDTESEIEYQTVFSVGNPFESSLNNSLNNGIFLKNAIKPNDNLCVVTDNENIQTCNYWYRGNEFAGDFKTDIIKFWNDFSSGKSFFDRDYTNAGKRDMCSLLTSVKAAPHSSCKVRFVLSWSIPDCFNHCSPKKDENGNDVTWKNYYATVFDTSKDSANYSIDNFDMLCKKTEEFKDCLYNSSVDEPFKEAAVNSISVLKTATVLRLEDGSFYGYEGVHANEGCCEGTCQHVWNYAYALCYLFPELERSIRDNEFKYTMLENGDMSFRISLPLGRKEYVNYYSNGTEKFRSCIDGHMGAVIKTYREWKISGDGDWLKEKWQYIKKGLSFVWSEENPDKWDIDRDGVLEGRQHHTLDMELFGPSGWLQGFYLAALKAAGEMAEYLNDEDAKEYNRLYENGYEWTKNNLFNGEYFIHKVNIFDKAVTDEFDCSDIYWNSENNEIKFQIANGCFIDQLIAQWHSYLSGLGDIFDKEQVKTAVLNIYKNNYHSSFREFVNPWRLYTVNDEAGTVMCSYPNGDRPSIPVRYGEETMSGFEYALAAVLLKNGYYSEAKNVVKAVRDKYDGEKRNPYNEIECGSNYARCMAAFSFFPIFSGFVPDMVNKSLKFEPVCNTNDFNCFWSTGSGWGIFKCSNASVNIEMKYGEIELKSLCLPFVDKVNRLEIDGKPVPFEFSCGIISFELKTVKSKVEVKY